MVNRPKISGTNAESLVREYCKENGWPYAKRLSLSGAKDVGDIDLHPKLTIEVKATQGALKIGPWMNEVDAEQLHAGADYGILVVKYPGVGGKRVGRFLTCMRYGQAAVLIEAAKLPRTRYFSERHGIKQEPVKLLRELDWTGQGPSYEYSMIIHQARGKTPDQDYHFMWLQDRLELLKLAGYGETRHLERSTDGTER